MNKLFSVLLVILLAIPKVQAQNDYDEFYNKTRHQVGFIVFPGLFLNILSLEYGCVPNKKIEHVINTNIGLIFIDVSDYRTLGIHYNFNLSLKNNVPKNIYLPFWTSLRRANYSVDGDFFSDLYNSAGLGIGLKYDHLYRFELGIGGTHKRSVKTDYSLIPTNFSWSNSRPQERLLQPIIRINIKYIFTLNKK
ncbi:MAG: hypothetical protein ACLGGV_04860 [Bacteroidia bacterium]